MSEAIERGKALIKIVSELSNDFDIERNITSKLKTIIPFCRRFLEECGFKVIAPYRYKYDHIDNINDLIDFFYERFKYAYPNKLIVRDEKIDLHIAKDFIESLKDRNAISNKAALTDCAEIIDTVIKNAHNFEEIFRLGFRIFGQSNMSYITERAIGIINSDRETNVSDDMERLLKEAIDTYDGGDIGMLSDLEERYGKKEE